MNANATTKRRQARKAMRTLENAYSHLCDRQDRNPIDGYVCDVDVDAYAVISRAMDRISNSVLRRF